MRAVIDLFCGAGGLSLGAWNAGLVPVLSIDIDKTLTASYSANFPNSNLLNADLLNITPQEVRRKVGTSRITAVVGGPPCQGFSSMGRRQANDPRNDLLRRYFEFVAALEPRFFLMENVPGLIDPVNRGTLDSALEVVPSRYTILGPIILDAADYGAATSRPRLVVVGYDPSELDRLDIDDFSSAKAASRASVRDAIADLPDPSHSAVWRTYRKNITPSSYSLKLRTIPPMYLGSEKSRKYLQRGKINGFQATKHSDAVRERFKALTPGKRDSISKYPKLDWGKPAFVLRAGTGNDKGSYQAARPIHPEQPRVISVREAARIQGFPDWFQFHETKWHSHRMIGNSVSPIFAQTLLEVIMTKMGEKMSSEAAE